MMLSLNLQLLTWQSHNMDFSQSKLH